MIGFKLLSSSSSGAAAAEMCCGNEMLDLAGNEPMSNHSNNGREPVSVTQARILRVKGNGGKNGKFKLNFPKGILRVFATFFQRGEPNFGEGTREDSTLTSSALFALNQSKSNQSIRAVCV